MPRGAARQLRVRQAVAGYAGGWFPLDDRPEADELPWYSVAERAVFELDAVARDAVRRRVRRSVRACAEMTWAVDDAFAEVLADCARPPSADDGVWITPRLASLYADLHEAGVAHSFELWTPDGELAAGILGIVLGRATMLESQRRRRPHAGNALLSRTLDELAARGVGLCDIQMATPHTERLGARLIPQADYERRLAAALA